MKILYLTDRDLDDNSGVSNKILMQSSFWEKECDINVDLISLYSFNSFNTKGEKLTDNNILFKNNKIGIIFRLFLNSYRLKKYLSSNKYTLIYSRYKLYDPIFRNAIKNTPLFVEINTDDVNEYLLKSKLLYFYNKIFRNLFLKHVFAFIFVSKELKNKFTKYSHRSSIVLANGVDVKELYFNPNPNNKRPQIVFIGSLNQKWQGYEKVINLSKELNKYDFHIIGSEGINTHNLFYHGYLSNDKAAELIGNFDIGIGTLSLYKKDMIEASPLKSRQYLAQGLPIIYAYDDTDIEKEYSFALKIENTENNVFNNIDNIKIFIDNTFKNFKIRNEARNFALEKLDRDKKEKERINFMKKNLMEKK